MSIPKDFFDNMDDAFDQKAEADKEGREAESWNPNPGDAIKGIFMKVEYIETEYGVKPLAFIRDLNNNNEAVKVWLSSVVLQEVVDFSPPQGCPIGIRYEGMERSKAGREFKNYTIVLPEGLDRDQRQLGYQQWQQARENHQAKVDDAIASAGSTTGGAVTQDMGDFSPF